MARNETGWSGSMALFVSFVETGDYPKAARARRKTPSTVSRLIGRLEGRLSAPS